jgi:hypothetical protein
LEHQLPNGANGGAKQRFVVNIDECLGPGSDGQSLGRIATKASKTLELPLQSLSVHETRITWPKQKRGGLERAARGL